MRLLVTVLLASLGFTAHSPVSATPSPWRDGKYELIREQGRTGILTLHTVSEGRATFSLEVVTCNPRCGDELAVNHLGVIENESIALTGASGTYVSANEEDGDLGHCVLRFSLKPQTVRIEQSGTCWWFGVGVGVSGTYRARDSEP